DDDQHTVEQLLQECDVVIIKGKMGGLGKTSLACSIAHQLKGQYPDGVLWVRAAQLTFVEIAKKLLYSLSFASPDLAGEIRESSLEHAYRQMLMSRCALIIIDDLSSMQILKSLIPPDTNSKFVITTRTLSNVGLQGVKEFELPFLCVRQ